MLISLPPNALNPLSAELNPICWHSRVGSGNMSLHFGKCRHSRMQSQWVLGLFPWALSMFGVRDDGLFSWGCGYVYVRAIGLSPLSFRLKYELWSLPKRWKIVHYWRPANAGNRLSPLDTSRESMKNVLQGYINNSEVEREFTVLGSKDLHLRWDTL